MFDMYYTIKLVKCKVKNLNNWILVVGDKIPRKQLAFFYPLYYVNCD